MAGERQKGDRVAFERGINAHMMGIDGTWRRDCMMEDVSETGARLTVAADSTEEQLRELALGDPQVVKHVEGKTVRKVVVAAGSLVSIVVS